MRAVTLLLCAVLTVYAHAQEAVRFIVDSADEGKVFYGVGATSGGGGISRLLINYPEPQRSQILDLLFKPNYGASLHILKVEIGGDGNSTEGAEPSHMHYPDDENYERGYEWWMMKEAKRRNPNIRLQALAWDYPGWLKEVNSPETAEYLAKFVLGAKRVHGLHIDDIGIWNETKTDYSFIKLLRQTLDKHGLTETKISADDLVNKWTIADEIKRDPELRKAIDSINTHYPRFRSSRAAKESGMVMWSGEDGAWSDEWAGSGEHGAAFAELLNRNYINGVMNGTVLWCIISAYYDILDLPNAGLMRAATPWSGHFEVMSPIWVVAHTTQFAQPGWKYLDSASKLLPGGGSYVALHDGKDYSIIIETLSAAKPQTLEWTVAGALSTGEVHVWRTNRNNHFEKLESLKPSADGKFTVSIEPDSVYSLTTTTGQQKGAFTPAPPADFPLPYTEDFESYEVGNTTPRYFIEQNGAYDVVEAAGGRSGKALRQVVNQSPIVWTSGKTAHLLGTASIIGDKRWRNYSVGVDAYLEEPGYARVIGRIGRCTLDGQINGYQLYLHDTGKWELCFATQEGVLKSGTVGPSLKTWRRLELTFDEDRIVASIDGKEVANVTDDRFGAGMAGIGNDFNIGQYDNFTIRPLASGVAVISPPPSKAAENVPPKEAAIIFVPSPVNEAVRLSWSKVEGATGYKIKYGTRRGQYNTTVDARDLTNYTVRMLNNGTRYFFIVVPYNAAGEGPPSKVQIATPGN